MRVKVLINDTNRCRRLECDRYMSPDMEAATQMIVRGDVWRVVEPFMRRYAKEIEPNEPWYPNLLAALNGHDDNK